MAGPSVIRRDKNMLLKWLGPNRGTHWTVAGAVAVIMIGGYLVYSIRDSNNSIIPLSATVQTAAPIAPAAPTSKK
jgi:hypothetical protein